MSKYVSYAIIAVLAIGVVGGGIFWLGQLRSGGDTPEETIGLPRDESFGQLDPAAPGGQQQISTQDDDNDGLLDADEVKWGSDPNNADTDGDGYLDGEEIAAGHDPTKPAPDDKLTVPVEALPAVAVALQADQYFADNVSLVISNKNLTSEYEGEYDEGVQSPATMVEFADKQEVEKRLPRPDSDRLPQVQDDSPALVRQFIEHVDNENALANPYLYAQAQYDLQERGYDGTMRGLSQMVRIYQDSLDEVPLPQSGVELYRLLLGYTDLLAATFDQIATWGEDPVKSMVATRQLEVIDRQYYPLINREVERLRALSEGAG